MNYSAQAIILDRDGNFYLEDNKVTNSLSFIGGKLEQGESFIQAVIRELEEEIGILLPSERFLGAREQPVRKFWNSRKGTFLDWKSTYYTVILESEEVKMIQANVEIEVYTVESLSTLDQDKFPKKRKNDFLAEIQTSLEFL